MSDVMKFQEFIKYNEEFILRLKKLNEGRTSKDAMEDVKIHTSYFIIRIELVKLLRSNKKVEYSRLYAALEEKSIISCIREKDNKLYELPHGVYVIPAEGRNLGDVEKEVLEALENCLKPLYKDNYTKMYTTLISGPAPILFKNLEKIDPDESDV